MIKKVTKDSATKLIGKVRNFWTFERAILRVSRFCDDQSVQNRRVMYMNAIDPGKL